jgi:dTDP-4-amino-4,6-dideoxygalactose transaminase
MNQTVSKIEFYKHNLNNKDWLEVEKVLHSLFLTTGEQVKLFENKFAQYLGIEHVIGVTSCTDALFLALKGLGVGPGDEVITTPLSFIATANSIEYCGAKPVFVDVESETGNIDADLIENAITKRTKAILAVHLYGQMCDMRKISRIAKKYNLKVVEDAAHCIEGVRDGIKVGELSDATCFSFYATKNLTSGEGGAIACNNKKLADWFFKARQHGMSKSAADRYTKRYEHYDMEFLGYKTNMTNIQAALILHQLDRLAKYRDQKEAIAQLYDTAFDSLPHIERPQVLPNTLHARHLYTIWVDSLKRDAYLSTLQDELIGVAVNFRVIHLMKYYREKYGYSRGEFPVAEIIGDRTISLPFYPKLTRKEIKRIITKVIFLRG